MHIQSVLAALSAVVVLASPLQGRQEAAPTVTISNGAIIGTTTQYADATATNNKFLGIPYAKSPPVRFGMPEPARPWSEPIDATKFKTACPQKEDYPGQTPGGISEDCLYVNVYTPAGTTAGGGKAVMLWIYGGNLQVGSASADEYDGSSIAANQDVIVVTFGYRIDVFGFSNAPEISLAERNVGFHDQRLALHWVKENIQAFGGDPTKITIFGQSAGGYSVKQLLRLPPSPLPYRAAIMESQATLILGNGTENWKILASELGCTGSSTLACMQTADLSMMQAIIKNQSLGFPPVEDRVTFLQDVYPSFASAAANVPVVIGTNGQEASIVSRILGLDGTPITEVVQMFTSFLPGVGSVLVNILNGLLLNNPLREAVDALVTDIGFQCDAAKLTQTLHDSGRPVWRYYYNASFPNTEPFPGAGAYHGAEIPEVFGVYPRQGATQQQIGLSKYMQKAWADFAKNPNTGPTWPGYGAAQNVGNLGANGSPGEATVHASDIDGTCRLLSVLGGLASLLPKANSSSEIAGALEQTMRLGHF